MRENNDLKRQITILESCEALDELQLIEFKEDLEIRLPDDYRKFILRDNGGRVRPERFLYYNGIYQQNEKAIVDRFLCIGFQGDFNIANYRQIYKNRIGNHLLPIATDIGGNVICLGITSGNFGSVFLWDHDFEPDTDEPFSADNVYPVADSFTAFLALLEN